MNNIPRAPPEVRQFSGSTDRLEKKVPLNPDQKSVESIIDLASKSCEAGGLMLDTFVGTLAPTKESFQLSKHCLFLGCEKSFPGFQDVLLFQVEI